MTADMEISIHVPARGTTIRKGQVLQLSVFQSTFPRGERLGNWLSLFPEFKFQSTFPRGERLNTAFLQIDTTIFQSTFPRGERLNLQMRNRNNSDFNPRSREGNDRSIRSILHRAGDFNPRSREGNDALNKVLEDVPALFQSTFPRGERPQKLIRYVDFFFYFNPRSREGNDSKQIN